MSQAEADEERAPLALMLLWSVILLLMPVYFFSSGLPQPADFAMAAFLGLAAVLGFSRLEATGRQPVETLGVYVVVVALINLFWFASEGSDTSFVFSIAFAVFNLLVFAGFVSFSRRYPQSVLRWTGVITAISLLFQGALAVARPDLNNGARLILLFNNPNQLAYYCLGAGTIVLLIDAALPRKLPRALMTAALVAGAYVIYATYSRSALGGYLMLCCVPFIRRPKLVIGAALLLVLVGLLVENPMSDDPLWQRRIEESGEQPLGDYMQDRGVERIVKHPEYILLGSGEGAHHRFNPFGLELHSSAAAILFYYGLPGFGAFAWFLYLLLRGFPLSFSAYLAPVLVYSFFHNALRFRIFWLLLGVMAVIRVLDVRAESPRARRGSPARGATRAQAPRPSGRSPARGGAT